MKALALNQTCKFLAILTLVPFLWACGDSKKQAAKQPPAAVKYEALNGHCYTAGPNRQLAPPTSCGLENKNEIFIYDGKQCFDTIAKRLTDVRYCTSSQFQSNGTTCFDRLANKDANPAYCKTNNGGIGNAQYVYQNGICISVMTGVPAHPTQCQNTGGSNSGQCMGWYYTYYWGRWYRIYCSGWDCQGLRVYRPNDTPEGQQLTCM